ncbi:MAG TPA: SRPBCC family protein [Desulfomonilia bacterium]|nr:SRPBCC family protein [Desulfomonilia bacterium]
MRFACRPVGLDFLESAPIRILHEVEIKASPGEVFNVLADADAWPRFLKDVVRTEWTSPEPHGVGSTRMIVLKGMTARERFIAWEQGKRFTFYIAEATAPLARALCEDYRLEPADGGKTRLTYVLACDPTFLLRLIGPVGRRLLAGLCSRVAHGLEDFMKGKGVV